MSKVYVTYDLEESGPSEPEEIYRGAHETPIRAQAVIRFEVGEFKRAWGRDVYGVRIYYQPLGEKPLAEEKMEEEIFEIPANARNVQVHIGTLPREYRGGLLSAA